MPEDLKFFQRETLGGALIMGRNTWDSLPVKPLSKRLNIVVSSNSQLTEHVAGSVAELSGSHSNRGISGSTASAARGFTAKCCRSRIAC